MSPLKIFSNRIYILKTTALINQINFLKYITFKFKYISICMDICGRFP